LKLILSFWAFEIEVLAERSLLTGSEEGTATALHSSNKVGGTSFLQYGFKVDLGAAGII